MVRNDHILPSNLLNLNPSSTPRYLVPFEVPLGPNVGHLKSI